MKTIKDVYSASQFMLTFVGQENAQGAVIYANNENKVAVNVSVNLYDENHNDILLDPGVFLHNLALYAATGAEDTPLDWRSDTDNLHLHYSNFSSEFTGPVQFIGGASMDTSETYGTGNNNFTFYIWANQGVAKTSTVYARLNGLNKEKFQEGFIDTYHSRFGMYGTSNKTIQCLDQINYSQSRYWILDTSSPYENRNSVDVQWTNADGRWITGSPKAIHTSRKIYVRLISPPGLPEHKILSRKISGDTFGEHGNAGSFFTNYVSADYGYGLYADEYNKVTWWVEPALEGRHNPAYPYFGYQRFDRYIKLYQYSGINSCYVRTSLDAELNSALNKVIDNAITLYSWNVKIAYNKMAGDNWSDISHKSTITIFDNYGNTGQFTIAFPTSGQLPELIF